MFHPGKIWLDSSGNPIQAHGGGILYDGDTYYWYGENKAGETRNQRVDIVGISCYSSNDLYHWEYRGLALSGEKDDLTHDLHTSKIAERPKVVFNRHTKQYVMWLHVEYARL